MQENESDQYERIELTLLGKTGNVEIGYMPLDIVDYQSNIRGESYRLKDRLKGGVRVVPPADISVKDNPRKSDLMPVLMINIKTGCFFML